MERGKFGYILIKTLIIGVVSVLFGVVISPVVGVVCFGVLILFS